MSYILPKSHKLYLKQRSGAEKLGLPVNDTAQTLMDNLRYKRQRDIERKVALLENAEEPGVRVHGSYKTRMRSGVEPMTLAGVERKEALRYWWQKQQCHFK